MTMARHGRGSARRRPLRQAGAGRRRGQHDTLIARRRLMPPPVNLPEQHQLGRMSLALVEPLSPALH